MSEIILVEFKIHSGGLTAQCDTKTGNVTLWRAARDEQDVAANDRTITLTADEARSASELLEEALIRRAREDR